MRSTASRHVVKRGLENTGNDGWSQTQKAVLRRMCWVCRSTVGSWGLCADAAWCTEGLLQKDVGFSAHDFSDNCNLPLKWRCLARFWKLQWWKAGFFCSCSLRRSPLKLQAAAVSSSKHLNCKLFSEPSSLLQVMTMRKKLCQCIIHQRWTQS